MVSLKYVFESLAKKYPTTGDYIIFHRTIAKRGWNEQIIRRWFYKLVNPEEYDKKDAKELLSQLVKIGQKH